MHTVIATLLLMLVSLQAFALDINHCPIPTNIKASGNIYTASASNRNGQWVGVLPGEEPAPIATFVKGIYYATAQNGANRGAMDRCIYRTITQKTVDLRFRPNQDNPRAVKLLDQKSWKTQLSETGLTQYICTSKKEGGCVFAVIE